VGSRTAALTQTPYLQSASLQNPASLPANLGFSWVPFGPSYAATVVAVVEESIDGAPWVELSRAPLTTAQKTIAGRGDPWLPGDATARLVAWRWRVRAVDSSGGLVGAIATDPVILRAVRAGVT
jgi:hypothetical protein